MAPREARVELLLRDGLGLAGGGPRPGTRQVLWVDPDSVRPPDPYALLELGRDIRPPDYATTFARLAAQLSGLERPLTVCTAERPDWLRAVAEEPGVEESTAAEAFAHYAVIPKRGFGRDL